MSSIDKRLAALGLKIPEILLPAPGIVLEKWAVIACDQFTQDESYWAKVRDETQNIPTTLDLIFPEVYLEANDESSARRTNAIHNTMKTYLENGTFAPSRRTGIYLERSTPYHQKRRGLVFAIDLEKYNWVPGTRPLIRATEGTVPERLPPRMEIRRGAPIETSHVLLLIDDEDDAIITGIGSEVKKSLPIYDSTLMMNSGSVTGWAIDSEKCLALLASGLENLAQKAEDRYAVKDEVPFLYAVGDGNHSLAAAKAVWEEYKAAHAGPVPENAACRYAMVELENIHDPGIRFEPIHRIIFGAESSKVLEVLGGSPHFSLEPVAATETAAVPAAASANVFRVISKSADIAAVYIEPMLEKFIEHGRGIISMDYIHGKEEVYRLANEKGQKATGILLPPINKNGFFKTIANNGPLPRKSFSMGEAIEKRFYIECRKLVE